MVAAPAAPTDAPAVIHDAASVASHSMIRPITSSCRMSITISTNASNRSRGQLQDRLKPAHLVRESRGALGEFAHLLAERVAAGAFPRLLREVRALALVLTDVVSPQAMRRSHTALQQEILGAIRSATQQAAAALNQTVEPVLGERAEQFREAFNAHVEPPGRVRRRPPARWPRQGRLSRPRKCHNRRRTLGTGLARSR
ncbi:hypothetical protein AB0383_00415 [Amycolatopsis sp. NPDC051373]|uniref:hypothetical protein n=1 Tax=Amycolatopsis sp. NPDC051373 TaxID=3155801 RepID=UPI00344C750F